MATKKIAAQAYNISAHLKIDVGMNITANSLAEAVEKANALKIDDFIDFTALGLDHNDSENPDIYSVWRG